MALLYAWPYYSYWPGKPHNNESSSRFYWCFVNKRFSAYGINRKLLDSLHKEIVIMHPGPINRGVELDSDVADSKQSIILDQVENGVAIRMAVLFLLAGQTP